MSARRGLTLHELISTVAVVSSILALMAGTLGQVTTVRNETLALTSVRERALNVRGAVERTLEGWPLRQLTALRTRRPGTLSLHERDPRAGAVVAARWTAGAALVTRTGDGYRVLTVENGRLVEVVLVDGQAIHRRRIAERVSSARFQTQRDASGAMNGVSYHVTLAWPKRPDGSNLVLRGFVGQRLSSPPAVKRRRTVREVRR